MENSQKELVLKHMKICGSITSMEAFEHYGITRLSAVVFELKKAGHNITSERMETKNRYGHKVAFSRYYLVKEN